MKAGKHARDLRREQDRKRKEQFAPRQTPSRPSPPPRPAPARIVTAPVETPEEAAAREAAEAREFLAYLEHETAVPLKTETPAPRDTARALIRTVNLEKGMPTADEAVQRMNVSLQEARASRVTLVKLIHGYGSTGKGGRIAVAVREELGRKKRRGLIRDFVPGEDFGPFGEGGRALADRCPKAVRDADYGRGNRGITMVLL